MKLADMNPFVRAMCSHANRIKSIYTFSYDHRLIYVHSGSITAIFGKEMYTAKKDTLLIWPSGYRYRLANDNGAEITIANFDYTQKYSHMTRTLSIAHESNFDNEKVLEQISFEDCDCLPGVCILTDMQRFEWLVRDIYAEYSNKDRYWRELASSKLRRLLIEAARASNTANGKTRETVEYVISYMRENYAKQITNRDIADQVNYHEYYVGKLVQKYTGQTLHRLLKQIRVENASRMLIMTDLSTAEIAEQCGFLSPAYFSDAFRQTVGESPSSFRKRHRGLV